MLLLWSTWELHPESALDNWHLHESQRKSPEQLYVSLCSWSCDFHGDEVRRFSLGKIDWLPRFPLHSDGSSVLSLNAVRRRDYCWPGCLGRLNVLNSWAEHSDKSEMVNQPNYVSRAFGQLVSLLDASGPWQETKLNLIFQFFFFWILGWRKLRKFGIKHQRFFFAGDQSSNHLGHSNSNHHDVLINEL